MKKTIYISIGILVFLSFSNELKAQDKSEGNKRSIITIYPVEIIYPKEISVEQKLTVFPNPASSIVEIRLDVPDQTGFYLELYNSMGKRVYLQSWNKGSLELSPFPSGVYLLYLRKDKEVYTQKLLIQR